MLHFAADTSRAVATSLRGVEQGVISKCEQAARPLHRFAVPLPRASREGGKIRSRARSFSSLARSVGEVPSAAGRRGRTCLGTKRKQIPSPWVFRTVNLKKRDCGCGANPPSPKAGEGPFHRFAVSLPHALRARGRKETERSALDIFLPRTKCGGGGAKRRRGQGSARGHSAPRKSRLPMGTPLWRRRS